MKHLLEDREGYQMGLHYLRDVSKREVDFLVTVDRQPWFAVECKVSAHSANPSLRYFGERLQIPYLYQVSLRGSDDVLDGRVRIMPAGRFLGCASLTSFSGHRGQGAPEDPEGKESIHPLGCHSRNGYLLSPM